MRASPATHEDVDDGGLIVDAKILGELVVGALDECAIDIEDGMGACLCHSGDEGHGFFFGDSDIDVLSAGLGSALWCEARHWGASGGHGYKWGVGFHLVEKELADEVGVVLGRGGVSWLGCLCIEGQVSGEEIYDEICDEIEDKEEGSYIFMSKKEDDTIYEYKIDVMEDQFNLSYLDIKANGKTYHIDFDN